MKWISVDEMLPEKSGKVIVFFSADRGIGVFYFRKDRPNFKHSAITHWMPLPEPPE